MADDDTTAFGRMRAKRGDRCSNPGHDDYFTTPCCYAYFTGKKHKCPECGAPIICEVEQQPVAVCRIPDPDEHNECEACDNEDEALICEGCGCCSECCNCTETDCDCDVCTERRENAED